MFRRLNKVGVCLGHSKTVELIRQLGNNHDEVVKRWKRALEVLRANDHEELPTEVTPDTDNDSYSTESDTDCNMCDDTLLASTTGLQLHTCMLNSNNCCTLNC